MTTPSSNVTFTNKGPTPPVRGFPAAGAAPAPSASDIAFGVGADGQMHGPRRMPPLMDENALRARTQRKEAERLLTAKGIASGQEAVRALEILLSLDDATRTKVIDGLSDQAFENLIDRLSDDQRARFATLVDASRNPQRKLRLWATQHTSRARDDLRQYKKDFGDPDGEQTRAQELAQRRFERRKTGVEHTEDEVAHESAALLAKGDKLTIEDVDALRARKDKELDVEMKHNIDLTAETTKRKDGSEVHWSRDEVSQLDSALDKLPKNHTEDDNSVATYTRRASPFANTRGGDYQGDHINIYDAANPRLKDRGNVPSVEYTAVHEIGHEAESENRAAFKKFEKVAGWKDVSEKELQGVREKDLEKGEVGDKLIKRDGDGKYHQVDASAMPSGDEPGAARWSYAAKGSHEHFAEIYAMAVETPELLYSDYVELPRHRVKVARAEVDDLSRRLQRLPKNDPKRADLEHSFGVAKARLATEQKTASQRRQLFDIIRNDIFKANARTRVAVSRLRARGVRGDAIQTFERKAARVSTPKQLAELEQQAMR